VRAPANPAQQRGANGLGENSVGGLSDPRRGVRSRGERRLEEAAGPRSPGMTTYLILFDRGAMTLPTEKGL
jgi:hypothetical protein